MSDPAFSSRPVINFIVYRRQCFIPKKPSLFRFLIKSLRINLSFTSSIHCFTEWLVLLAKKRLRNPLPYKRRQHRQPHQQPPSLSQQVIPPTWHVHWPQHRLRHCCKKQAPRCKLPLKRSLKPERHDLTYRRIPRRSKSNYHLRRRCATLLEQPHHCQPPIPTTLRFLQGLQNKKVSNNCFR